MIYAPDVCQTLSGVNAFSSQVELSVVGSMQYVNQNWRSTMMTIMLMTMMIMIMRTGGCVGDDDDEDGLFVGPTDTGSTH